MKTITTLTAILLASACLLMSSPVESVVSAPTLASADGLEYPVELRSQGIEGTALVEVYVGADGRVLQSTVLEATHDAFAEAALATVEQSTFLPATRDGEAIGSVAVLPVRFNLVAPGEMETTVTYGEIRTLASN